MNKRQVANGAEIRVLLCSHQIVCIFYAVLTPLDKPESAHFEYMYCKFSILLPFSRSYLDANSLGYIPSALLPDEMTISQLESEWQEDAGSKGHWNRKLVGGEKFCYQAVVRSVEAFKREAVALTTCVRLTTTMAEASLRDSIRMAWLQTRHDHPDIATTADSNGRKIFQSLRNAEEATQWLKETFIVAKEKSIKDIVHEAAPANHALLYWFPNSSHIALYSSHWRIDGTGCVQVLNRILSLVAEHPAGSTPYPEPGPVGSKLSPDYFRASGTSLEDRLRIQEQGRQINKALEEVDIDQSFKLPRVPGSDGQKPSGHLQIRSQFSVGESNRIFHSCRQKGFSVTVGIQTTYVLALLAMNKPSNSRPTHGPPPIYSSAGRICFRQFLPRPYNSPTMFPATMYTAVGTMSVPVTTFTDTAVRFSSAYRSLLVRARNGEGTSMSAMFTFLADNPNGLALFMALPYITSLGNLESMLPVKYESGDKSRRLRVNDFSFSVAQLGKGVAGMLWTFDGRLTLEVGFNEAFYAAETVEAFLEEVKRITLTELG